MTLDLGSVPQWLAAVGGAAATIAAFRALRVSNQMLWHERDVRREEADERRLSVPNKVMVTLSRVTSGVQHVAEDGSMTVTGPFHVDFLFTVLNHSDESVHDLVVDAFVGTGGWRMERELGSVQPGGKVNSRVTFPSAGEDPEVGDVWCEFTDRRQVRWKVCSDGRIESVAAAATS